MRLCGIISRFQLLSPSIGQVTHALLTRPPLSFRKCKHSLGSVRLACVKHAASVHPEPGSNSHVICCVLAKPKCYTRSPPSTKSIKMGDAPCVKILVRIKPGFILFTVSKIRRLFHLRNLQVCILPIWLCFVSLFSFQSTLRFGKAKMLHAEPLPTKSEPK